MNDELLQNMESLRDYIIEGNDKLPEVKAIMISVRDTLSELIEATPPLLEGE